MENENENFDKLKTLLTLKRHELPPPGYFNKLPREVVSRLRAERAAENVDAMTKLKTEAPWLMKFWRTLQGKPAFAVSFGTVICSLMLAAIFFAEKPPVQPPLAGVPAARSAPLMGGSPDVAPVLAVEDKPILVATNQTQPNLFEMESNGQTAPVNFRP
jgi:hypothetical protein